MAWASRSRWGQESNLGSAPPAAYPMAGALLDECGRGAVVAEAIDVPATGPSASACRPAAGSGTAERKQPRIGVQRAVEDLVGRPCSTTLPPHHHEHVVGHVPRARDVVRDVEERDVAVSLESAIRLRIPRRIETSSIEIGSSASTHPRLHGERAGNCDPLPLAADSSCGNFAAMTCGGTSPTASAARASLADLALGDDAWIRSGRAMWCSTL